MMKIEFDESNLILVLHIAHMLDSYVDHVSDRELSINVSEVPVPSTTNESLPEVPVPVMHDEPVPEVHDEPVPVMHDEPVPVMHDEQPTDTEGLVWDARIHSSGKTKTQAGAWKIMRKPKRFETDEEWKLYISDIIHVAEPVPEVQETTTNFEPLPIVDVAEVPVPTENVLAPITDLSEFVQFITNGPCPMEYNAVIAIARKYGMQTSIMEFGTPEMLVNVPLMYKEIMGIS